MPKMKQELMENKIHKKRRRKKKTEKHELILQRKPCQQSRHCITAFLQVSWVEFGTNVLAAISAKYVTLSLPNRCSSPGKMSKLVINVSRLNPKVYYVKCTVL